VIAMPPQTLRLIPTLRARWRLALSIWLAMVAALIAISLVLPPRYEASATLVLDIGNVDPVRGQEVFKPAGSVSTYQATQIDVLKSEEVARGALRSLGVTKQQEWIDKWRQLSGGQGDFEAWLSGELLRKLAIVPSRDSNALTLSYTSQDREFSAALVNAIVKSYMDTTLQMRAVPARQFNAFFEERAKPLRQALEQAKSRLSDYEHSQDEDIESRRLAELTTQLVALQDEATGASDRQKQAAKGADRMREVRNDPEVMALMAELAQEEGGLAKLKTEFGERHPTVVQAQRAIAELRGRLSASMGRAATTFAVPVKANEARLAEVRSAIERQRAIVLKRRSQRNAAAVLLRDVDNAQKAYDAVLQRASQTSLEAASTTQTNVSVVKWATPPAFASSMLLVNLIVATLLGPLLAIATALLQESRDRRLRTFEDVTRLLKQPLLLALPDGYALQGDATRRSLEMQRRLVSGKPRLLGPR
jgi:succinoglycan biosynthesis transport protein ExoP